VNWKALKTGDRKIDKIVDALQSIALSNGVGYRITRTMGGTTLNIKGGSDGSILYPPFYVLLSGDADDGEPVVKVKEGTVNNFLPVTIGGYDGEDWKFRVTGERWIYLNAELNGSGAVTGVSLNIADSVPANGDGNPETGSAPSNTYLAVAKIEYDDGNITITNFLGGSQTVQCVVSSWSCSTQTVRVLWSQI
jgi:hypothetical protein